MNTFGKISFLVCYLCSIALVGEAHAALNIAVASNFSNTMTRIVSAYEDESHGEINLLTGSSGKHYLQISYGAPIDLFFSADQKRPQALVEQGKAHAEFTYAIGYLAFWVPEYQAAPIDFGTALRLAHQRIALANPKHAPYGFAAQQTLQHADMWSEGAKQSYVFADNINHAFAMVKSKAVPAGFVAYTQMKTNHIDTAQYWLVPREYYQPIKQDAVVITDNEETQAFLDFFRSEQVKAIIEADGYVIP